MAVLLRRLADLIRWDEPWDFEDEDPLLDRTGWDPA